MTDAAPNDFNQAAAEFLSFLKRENVAKKVEWIFPEDLQVVNGCFYVRVPIPGGNLARASAEYSEGLERGLGIALSVICWIGDCAYANVYFPHADREAELHLMPTGLPTRLKLSYVIRGGWDGEPSRRDERREAIPVGNKVKWQLLRRKGSRNETMKSHLFD